MPILDPGPQQIAYQLQGPPDAPVLLLSNSLGTTMSMWDPQADSLAGHFRVLRYDTRGHGASGLGDAPAGAVTLAQLGADVLRLLDALGIRQAHFCGISMGGLTGLWLGIHAGARIRRLVVANSAARIGTADGWRQRAGLVTADGMDAVADGAASRWFTPGFAERSAATVNRMIDELRGCPPAGYAACCLALAEADLREQLGLIAVPTLVLAGRFDAVTTLDDAHFIRERIDGARGLTLEASHLSNIEAAAGFTGALRAHLA